MKYEVMSKMLVWSLMRNANVDDIIVAAWAGGKTKKQAVDAAMSSLNREIERICYAMREDDDTASEIYGMCMSKVKSKVDGCYVQKGW